MNQVAYVVKIAPSAEKYFCKLSKAIAKRIGKKLDLLAKNPRPPGVEKLSGKQSIYRVRSGDYRIVYEIQDKVLLVLILAIGHRKEVYRDI